MGPCVFDGDWHEDRKNMEDGSYDYKNSLVMKSGGSYSHDR